MGKNRHDLILVLVSVPPGVRDTDEIKEKLIKVMGIERVVWDENKHNPEGRRE